MLSFEALEASTQSPPLYFKECSARGIETTYAVVVDVVLLLLRLLLRRFVSSLLQLRPLLGGGRMFPFP